MAVTSTCMLQPPVTRQLPAAVMTALVQDSAGGHSNHVLLVPSTSYKRAMEPCRRQKNMHAVVQVLSLAQQQWAWLPWEAAVPRPPLPQPACCSSRQ